jgi:tRNA pseudouridine13 synthase
VALPDLPYITDDLPGIGGKIRVRDEDFFVQELPLYEASGEGEHILAEVQKVGIDTREMVRRLANALDLRPADIGTAGLKDRHAVAVQLVSIHALPASGIDEERVMRVEAEGLVVRWAARHANKLRPGHAAGNRFAIRIREIDNPATAAVRVRPVLDRLNDVGLPNYYGEQRFGTDPTRPNDKLGLLLLRGENEAFLKAYLGGDDFREDVAAARRIYDEGDAAAAFEAWPMNIKHERRVLEKLVRTGDPAKAVKAVDKSLRRLLMNAAQSAVFNAVTADRVRDGLLGRLVRGDAAMKRHDDLRTGGVFTVHDAAAEQSRADAWELTPTGPMPGGKMHPRPTHDAADRETAALTRLGVTTGDFETMPGARRPMRIRPSDTRVSAGVDDHGGHVTIAFSLPAGSFATVVLREVMKPDRVAASLGGDAAVA